MLFLSIHRHTLMYVQFEQDQLDGGSVQVEANLQGQQSDHLHFRLTKRSLTISNLVVWHFVLANTVYEIRTFKFLPSKSRLRSHS